MSWLPKRLLPGVATAALAVAGNLLLAGSASAHVKWFCAFDVAGQPRGLENVLCADFELLVLSSILLLICGGLVEKLPIGGSILGALDRVSAPFEERGDVYVRAVLAFF